MTQAALCDRIAIDTKNGQNFTDRNTPQAIA